MTINKQLAGILIVFFLMMLFANFLDSYRTKLYQDVFMEKHEEIPDAGKVDTLRVTYLNKAKGEAKVFYVETLTDEDGSKYQVGRMVPFEYIPEENDWNPLKKRQKIMWDDRRKKGNTFTFPPYIGRDKSILLKR